jgi:hypothetical protein
VENPASASFHFHDICVEHLGVLDHPLTSINVEDPASASFFYSNDIC